MGPPRCVTHRDLTLRCLPHRASAPLAADVVDKALQGCDHEPRRGWRELAANEIWGILGKLVQIRPRRRPVDERRWVRATLNTPDPEGAGVLSLERIPT